MQAPARSARCRAAARAQRVPRSGPRSHSQHTRSRRHVIHARWQPQDKIDAMAPEYKCYEHGGFKCHGVGNPQLPKMPEVFKMKTFYFASCCNKWLKEEEQEKDLAAMSPHSRNRATKAAIAANPLLKYQGKVRRGVT